MDFLKGLIICGKLILPYYLMMNAGEFKSTDLFIVKTANGLESVLVKAKTSDLPITIPKDTGLEKWG